jgi:gliding motility-associated-like protein
MKKLLLFVLLFSCLNSLAQIGGTNCTQMQPICTDAGVQFTANSGGPDVNVSEPGNDYGCLGYSPNASWYYFEIATAGDIVMELSAATDIDFIIWGPFSSLAAAQSSCGSYTNIAPDTGCDFFGFCDGYGCSWSLSNVENPAIPNAQVGQVYVMLITNYDNIVQDITLTQISGTGATDCTIVNPTVCSISNFTATIGACNQATGNYPVTGAITYSNPPSSGNLVVQDCSGNTTIVANAAALGASGTVNYSLTLPANGASCSVNAFFTVDPSCSNGPISYTAPTCPVNPCYISNLEANISACQPNNSFTVTGIFSYENNPGSGTITVSATNASGTQSQTFNPPFTNGQNNNYSITMNSDGSPLTVSVTFSADPSCTNSITSTSPQSCGCGANVGTFTVTTDGTQSGNNIALCFGDVLTISPNGDWIPPGLASNPPAPEGYDPDIIWLVYTCPPSVAVTPDPVLFIDDDPCFFTLINSPNLSEVNDMFWTTNFPGTFTNNTVYFVPLTAYNVSVNPLLISYVNTSLDCYHMGPAYAVQYIPELTLTQSQDCPSGTVTATVSGGSPSINGSQFSAVVSSLLPSTANFVNTTAANNGTITVGGLVNGDNYSFDIQDQNGCTITVSGTFVGGTPSSISYPQSSYCENEPNPSPTITGAPGGVFSSTSGLSINANTGVINLLASNPGSYLVTYTPPSISCQLSSTFALTINALPMVNAGADVTVCEGEMVTLNGTGASSYMWTNGVQNGVPFVPTPGSTVYTLTGTSSAGCVNSDQITVTTVTATAVTFTPNVTTGCVPLTVTFSSPSSSSSDCLWDFGNGSFAAGCGSITTTYNVAGCYDVSLTVTSADGCTATFSETDLICVENIPEAYFIPSSNSVTEFENLIQFNNESVGAVNYLWNFGDNTSTSSETNPSHIYSDFQVGDTWTIMLVAASSFGCLDTAYATIFSLEDLIFYVPNTFTPDNDDYNQIFQPVFTSGFDPYDFRMLIFNRWGEIVFETHDATKGWDGSYGSNDEIEMVQDGTYTWKIEFKSSNNDKHLRYTGHVNLVR